MMKNNSNYEDFLKSDKWKALRAEVISRDNGRCVMCGSENNLVVHHLSYDFLLRDDEGNADHLITLCKKCHSDVHGFYKHLKEASELISLWYAPAAPKYLPQEKRAKMLRLEQIVLNTPPRDAQQEATLKAMVREADIFVVSRCSELHPGGDVKMMTSQRNVGILNDYIFGLFNFDPYHDSVSFWMERSGGIDYRRIINCDRYNSMRVSITKRNKERGVI